MEEAAAVRRAASEATADVVPAEFRDVIDDYVGAETVVPGVLTLLSARAVGGDSEGVEDLAAGVQLIYDGLRLTRDLAHTDPWSNGDRNSADMSILAADVLVARGFYLLARTDAAADAVAVVRSFGNDQTVREDASTDEHTELDRNLEGDVVELAIRAGITTGCVTDDIDVEPLAADIAPDRPEFDDSERFLDDRRRGLLAVLKTDTRPLNRND